MIKEFVEEWTTGRFTMFAHHRQFDGGGLLKPAPHPINTFVYNSTGPQKMMIDEVAYTLPGNCILPLVYTQNFRFEHPEKLVAWQFNREFYCIVDHDAEVGCAGFLFYGLDHPMCITLEPQEVTELDELKRAFVSELEVHDKFQGEMLRTLLKRTIIKVTRIAKQQQESYRHFPDEKLDLVRRLSLLVEGNFREQHSVKFYAEALNKSPKTLSNMFAILKQPAPSIVIRNRVMMEAKRYLHYTDKSAKEIAYELGFESAAHFSRLFKQHVGKSISDFRSRA